MEKRTCACCGGEIPAKDTEAVTLADGATVCSTCCAAVRILYPKSITWVNVYYSGDTDDDYDSDEDAVWLDPIAEDRPCVVSGRKGTRRDRACRAPRGLRRKPRLFPRGRQQPHHQERRKGQKGADG